MLAKRPSKKIKKEIAPIKGRKITKARLMRAIPGTGGLFSRIAKRLGSTPHTIKKKIHQEGWEDVREIWEAERDAIGDIAERTVQEMIQQRLDFGVASTNARWMLDRRFKERGYGEKTKLEIEGGENPLKFQFEHVVKFEDLDLPLAVRKRVLRAMKKKREEESEE